MEKLAEYIAARKPETMSDIARDLNVSRPFLYDLVDGKRLPSFDTALKISDATDGAVPVSSWPNIARIMQAGAA